MNKSHDMKASNRTSLLTSIRHAWHGIVLVFKTERSFRIQSIAAVGVFVLIFALPLEAWERAVLLLVAMLVLLLELLNSSVERIVDLVKPRLHEYAGDVKDVMAGAVLLSAIFACIIALVVLAPHLPLPSRV